MVVVVVVEMCASARGDVLSGRGCAIVGCATGKSS